jgi:hypothetical protein
VLVRRVNDIESKDALLLSWFQGEQAVGGRYHLIISLKSNELMGAAFV